MGYTEEQTDEYAAAILAAAIKEDYQGPIFLQGDHFQFNAKKYKENPQQEIEAIKALTKEAISAQFYNIDIDASTLVDLSQENLTKQQEANYQMTALLTTYIRSLQPKDTMISIGGEIGHIGDRNSNIEDFKAFMKGYSTRIPKDGISKVSVQTGTSHGGIPLPDGSIAKIQLDFNVLNTIGSD